MYRLDISLTASHTDAPHRYIVEETIEGLTPEELCTLFTGIETAVKLFITSRTEE